MAGFPTAGAAQILSRIVAVLPLPSKITGPAYMETAEGPPDTRTFQAMIQKLGERYSKTDRERSWGMWQEFTSRNRKPAGNVKDFRTRMQRVTTRLETLHMKMIEEAIPPKETQAPKVAGPHFAIVLSALVAEQNSQSADVLRDIAISMFEIHRHVADRSEVCAARTSD